MDMKSGEFESRSPNKRAFSLIVIILSCAFFLISLAGLAAIWVANKPLTDNALAELDAAQNELTAANTALQSSRAELESLQGQIDIFQEILTNLGTDAIQNTRLISEVVDRVESTISPLLERLSNGVGRIRETFDSIKETVANLNDLPLIQIEVPGEEVLNSVSEGLANLQSQITDTKTKVESVSQITQDTVDTLTSGFKTWEEYTARNLALIDQYEAKVAAYQAKLAHLEANLPLWIDLASIVLTFLLVWLAISQVGLFILAWQFYKSRDLLRRWR
jgi:TolA-binding protein